MKVTFVTRSRADYGLLDMIKPKRKVELIERVYWSCHKKNHRHASESTAEWCIKNYRGPKSKKHLATVLRCYRNRMSVLELANKYKVSKNTVYVWLRKAEW